MSSTSGGRPGTRPYPGLARLVRYLFALGIALIIADSSSTISERGDRTVESVLPGVLSSAALYLLPALLALLVLWILRRRSRRRADPAPADRRRLVDRPSRWHKY